MSEELDETTAPHGGNHVLDVAKRHGVDTVFTLSGAHVFPIYDAAVKPEPSAKLLDVRHEQTAVFAAEAIGKLTRQPGFAVLTAGPGVTNGVSAIAQAHHSGAPLVVLGGRAPAATWGSGTLQEVDHPPIIESISKSAETASSFDDIAAATDRAFTAAASAHRGPAFYDIPMDEFFKSGPLNHGPLQAPDRQSDTSQLTQIAELLAAATRPILVLGTDVWADGAENAARDFAEMTGIPVIANGMGRGILPGGHRLLMTKARSVAFGQCDVALVAGTRLDFRLGFGKFGGREGTDSAKTIHLADSVDEVSTTAELAASAAGNLTGIFTELANLWARAERRADTSAWLERLSQTVAATNNHEASILHSDANPIHPARIYGELLPRLADDAVVIGDGGDFVSFAGKFVEPAKPGNWLDPGPYGCLGAGMGAAIAARIARPSSQVVVLFGDGAAGMSLMDVDTLVRHNLPVVMIVGNNSAWGLEKMPMQMIYGYDVAADLAQGTRYDQVVTALGGGGELVTDPAQIGPAIDRAFASGIPYLVNIVTDVNAQYPRATLGV